MLAVSLISPCKVMLFDTKINLYIYHHSSYYFSDAQRIVRASQLHREPIHGATAHRIVSGGNVAEAGGKAQEAIHPSQHYHHRCGDRHRGIRHLLPSQHRQGDRHQELHQPEPRQDHPECRLQQERRIELRQLLQ